MTRTPSYCGSTDVIAQLQLVDPTTTYRLTLGSSPVAGANITLEEMNDRILQMEDYVESYCRDNWRIVSSQLEHYGVDNLWPGWYPHELINFLRNWHVQTFDAAAGDILQVRHGETWVDLLDGTHEEGLGKDYWVEYDPGIIHFFRTRPMYGTEQFRVKYRWGSTPVPYDIKRATVLLVAADYLKSELYAVLAGEGSGFVSNRERTIQMWEKQAEDIMNRHQRMPLVMVNM